MSLLLLNKRVNRTIQEDLDIIGVLAERVLVDPKKFDPKRYGFFREYHSNEPIGRRIGYAMFVRMKDFESVLDAYGDYHFLYDGRMSVNVDRIVSTVWNDWRADIEDGSMPFILSHSIEAISKDEFYDMINPEDIVDSAGLWDIYEFVKWFWDKYEYPAVEIENGAIVFDRKLIDMISVDKDEEFLDKISDYIY